MFIMLKDSDYQLKIITINNLKLNTMPIEYPKTLSVSELHEVDGLVMSKEICNRYNSHEVLCNEIERLQNEVSDQTFYKRVYAGVGILSMLTIFILILVNHD